MNKLGIIVMVVLAISLVSATSITDVLSTSGTINLAVGSFCNGLKTLLPVAAMLMIIIAGVIYAAGQMMGAETRARGNVWATAALTGALIAILIVVIAPPVLNAIYAGNGTIAIC